MEDLPESSDKRLFSYQEADAARDKFVEAREEWHRKVSMPHVGTGLERKEDGGWGVALFIEKERHEKRVLKLARKCISDVPVSVHITGVIKPAKQ
jgi:hypothetical protein